MILDLIALAAGIIVGLYFTLKSYTIVLLLTNGERKTIPATRFSVPNTNDIAKAEGETRTPASPRGSIVYGWYRVKQ